MGDHSSDENDNVFKESFKDITTDNFDEEPPHRSLRPRKSSEILKQTELTRKV